MIGPDYAGHTMYQQLVLPCAALGHIPLLSYLVSLGADVTRTGVSPHILIGSYGCIRWSYMYHI